MFIIIKNVVNGENIVIFLRIFARFQYHWELQHNDRILFVIKNSLFIIKNSLKAQSYFIQQISISYIYIYIQGKTVYILWYSVL